MNRDEFREALLGVMERKVHWAWSAFTRGEVAADRLHVHLEQEYGTYVRDFAVLLGRAYVQCPIDEVRRDLAENLYEEETGRLSRGRPHAELFLEYPRGLGMDLARFGRVELLPAAAAYRAALDDTTTDAGWELATAVTTIFVEGTRYERGELDPGAPRRPEPPLEQHPLVVHYGLPLSSLALTKVHRMVEGDHRAAAWRMVLDHVPDARRPAVVDGMEIVLARWLAYRDAVARACGLEPSAAPTTDE
ncbi:iron-containing redox enzyme family protein [Paraliomyxa miuraensis]|uniref:iron-containing redox enzyme family protein n=1 Tax=Paraliomyxa miuraensis TaxID=376150 RepID=UPI00225A00AE|nr:iron-containing redox enzyme family protein [Paraliomyxa miuraensis]MCX4241557.1 iron-containing redox enzyme family protein [Paraliomyxa miuraensis]